MIDKLIDKIIPKLHDAQMHGDGDCVRIDLFDGSVVIRYNPHVCQIKNMWLDQLEITGRITSAGEMRLRPLRKALHAEYDLWLEATITELED